MPKRKEIYTQMGFKTGASEGVKAAFLRHLTKAAKQLSPEDREFFQKQISENEQLSFDAEVLQGENPLPSTKRKVA